LSSFNLFKIKNRIRAEYQSPYKKKEGKKKSKLNINTTRKKQKNQQKMAFYDLSASTLQDSSGNSEELKFASLKGKVVLIENVASL